jgi:hypothetical protein
MADMPSHKESHGKGKYHSPFHSNANSLKKKKKKSSATKGAEAQKMPDNSFYPPLHG